MAKKRKKERIKKAILSRCPLRSTSLYSNYLLLQIDYLSLLHQHCTIYHSRRAEPIHVRTMYHYWTGIHHLHILLGFLLLLIEQSTDGSYQHSFRSWHLKFQEHRTWCCNRRNNQCYFSPSWINQPLFGMLRMFLM